MGYHIVVFIASLYMVLRGAGLATRHAMALAKHYGISGYTVGFIIVAFISILPETLISVNAALKDIPSFGLGMLFGSNIADLTLIFALVIFIAGRSLKIESKILKQHVVYPLILLLPIILGLDGSYSRVEGVMLMVTGAIFYVLALRSGVGDEGVPVRRSHSYYGIIMLVLSMGLLLVGSHFTVVSATALAELMGVSPILIGMLVVGLGTTMPEFFFALKSIRGRTKDDALAVGDILGTVLADATIVVGLLALINPFSFPQKIIYVTGACMVIASCMLFYFMRSGRAVSRREASFLFIFWLFFVLIELSTI